ncbi:MAG: glycosyltransferase family 4 protein [Bacteroidota bacterium]
MKIAYLSIHDSTNIRSYSGTGYFIPKSLMFNGADVHYIGSLKTKPYLPEKFNELFYRHIHKKIYWMNRQPRVIKNYARQIKSKIKEINPDVILSFSGPTIALLETDKPIVLWPDAVFGDIIDFYPEFTNMARKTIKNGNKMEQYALDRCSHIIYSSNWAAEGAMRHYNISRDKISVIPYGANIETTWDEETVEQKIQSKNSDHCNLLFVGVDWYRKGGNLALQVAKNLNKQGLKTELNVLGSRPDDEKNLPDYIKVHGFVSKETKEGKELIHNLISNAHFLILPTRADCTPIVFAEFNSYGIPCLTTKVGGIPTLIKDNVNGKLFSLDTQAEEYSEYILSLFKDYEQYKKLARSSFREYKERLNWEVSSKKVYNLLKQVIEKSSK